MALPRFYQERPDLIPDGYGELHQPDCGNGYNLELMIDYAKKVGKKVIDLSADEFLMFEKNEAGGLKNSEAYIAALRKLSQKQEQ